jgi:hypothetical protein
MAIAWSNSTFPPRSVMFTRRSFSRSGGLGITGIEQVVQSSTDYWAATLSFKIHSSAQILAYRALQAQNWGRSGEWIIPACPQLGLPFGGPPAADYSFGSDWGPDFSIGTAPTDIPPGEGALSTVLAAKGSRSITIQFIDPGFAPQPGMYFSIGNRLYLVGTVTPLGVRTFTITFAPGLRAAAPINTAVEFTSPRCLMRLAQDNEGELNLDWLRFAEISLNFVEVPA